MYIDLATITAIVSNDSVKQSDAVIWLEGDGLSRMSEVIRVFEEGLADSIVVSGGLDKPPIAIKASQLAEELYKNGITKEKVIIEETSQNTHEQGIEIMKMVKEKNWKRIILVASHYHQPRAFLTFLKAMQEAGMKIEIYNSPARDLPWFTKVVENNRKQLFEGEMQKIEEYSKKGHVAPIGESLDYQEWKESQS
jgi:uncharacterized SAM-binding protein YcdF (DUF218 family)